MAEYDPEIIEEYAGKLYAKALGIQIFMALVGGLMGLVFGVWMGEMQTGPRGQANPALPFVMIFSIAICGTVGWAIGRAMAFGYKLQAQTALCQVQIEKNTRGNAEAAGAR